MDDITRQRLNRELQGFRDRLVGMGLPVPRSLYFDRHGDPIGMGDWAILHSEEGYVRVAETYVGDAWVSTVWIGLDYGFMGGPPIIFETMIFGGPLHDYQDRYTSEADALRGHLIAVALAQSVPWWRQLAWIVAESYRQARDARPGGGWPRFDAPEVEPLWQTRAGRQGA